MSGAGQRKCEDFDPYHRWLGIPPSEQPASHYRLLGISSFEGDPEVIRDAGERQMRHVRTYQLGPNSAASQKILNELAAAKACLLDPDRKLAYDAMLRGVAAEVDPLPVERIQIRPIEVNPIKVAPNYHRAMVVVTGVAVGVCLVALLAVLTVKLGRQPADAVQLPKPSVAFSQAKEEQIIAEKQPEGEPARPKERRTSTFRNVEAMTNASSPKPNPAFEAKPPAQTDKRSRWLNHSYKSEIRHVEGKRWVEVVNATQKTSWHYTETGRTPEYIELFLEERKQTMRFSATRMDLNRGGKWDWVANGRWDSTE